MKDTLQRARLLFKKVVERVEKVKAGEAPCGDAIELVRIHVEFHGVKPEDLGTTFLELYYFVWRAEKSNIDKIRKCAQEMSFQGSLLWTLVYNNFWTFLECEFAPCGQKKEDEMAKRGLTREAAEAFVKLREESKAPPSSPPITPARHAPRQRSSRPASA